MTVKWKSGHCDFCDRGPVKVMDTGNPDKRTKPVENLLMCDCCYAIGVSSHIEHSGFSATKTDLSKLFRLIREELGG